MTGTAGAAAVATLPTDTSVLVTRGFAAPPQHVYRACTEPDLVRRWWSGGAAEVRIAQVEPRVGARWRVVVVGDGYVVGLHGEYREVVPGARIVRTEVDEGAPDAEAHAALCTYTFIGAGDRSTVSLLTALRTRDQRDALLDSGMAHGVQASWDLLEQVAVSLR
jgi:uncharacterized protein YndB with AHSA1/START domain